MRGRGGGEGGGGGRRKESVSSQLRKRKHLSLLQRWVKRCVDVILVNL